MMNSIFTTLAVVATLATSAGAVRTTCDSMKLCPADTFLKTDGEVIQCLEAICTVEECCESTEIISAPSKAVRTTCDSMKLCPADTFLKTGGEVIQCAAAICTVVECCDSLPTSITRAFMSDGDITPEGKMPTGNDAFVVTKDTYTLEKIQTSADIYIVDPSVADDALSIMHLTLTFIGEKASELPTAVSVVDHTDPKIDVGKCQLNVSPAYSEKSEFPWFQYTVLCNKLTIKKALIVNKEKGEGYELTVNSLAGASSMTKTFMKEQASVATVDALIKVFTATSAPAKVKGCDKAIKKAEDEAKRVAKKADGLANDLAERADVPVWAVYSLAGVTFILVIYFLKLMLCGCSKKKQNNGVVLVERQQFQSLA